MQEPGRDGPARSASWCETEPMKTLPLRLTPGQDLRLALESATANAGATAAFVLSGIGSLDGACLRLAGAEEPRVLSGDLEVLTLAGTIAANGSHLHAALATGRGEVLGGHLGYGCSVRTTAEVLLALLEDWAFSREPDAATGFLELVIQPRPPGDEDAVSRVVA